MGESSEAAGDSSRQCGSIISTSCSASRVFSGVSCEGDDGYARVDGNTEEHSEPERRRRKNSPAVRQRRQPDREVEQHPGDEAR